MGTNLLASSSFFGPVNMAVGRISPKINTKVTDSRTDTTGDTSFSKNSGRASAANAFRSRSVTRRRWRFLIIGRRASA
jgi:hypothetical protein